MLLRLDVVEEIGRFAALRHKAEQFNRLSLVFARNGYGKSTLCAVLRSASEGQPNYITARRRLDAKKESRVQSTWAPARTVAFGGGSWNSCPGKIYVFDQEFVHQNLHVGESVTRENKRSLLPVVLGEQGVVLAQKIIDLDREQRELANAVRGYASEIYARHPVITSAEILAFCTREIPADITERIEIAERSVQLAKQAATVQQKLMLKQIDLPSIEYFQEIAARTIESVSDDIAARVRKHIETHDLGTHGDRWLKYGIEHFNGTTCPFCDQNVVGHDLVASYATYFSEAFNQLLADRDGAIANLDQLLGESALLAITDATEVDAAFWSQVCKLPNIPKLDAVQLGRVISGLETLRALLTQKIANPIKAISLEEGEALIMPAFALIEEYREALSACNAAISVAKAEVQGIDLLKAERIHSMWLALAAKQSDPIMSAAAAYAGGEARRKEIETEKKTAQDELTAYADTMMKTRQKQINGLLSAFGANFSITNAKANFKGRDPNTEYAISIGQSTLPVGDKSDTAPSFKTVLSAGDKTTLALAFFITQVRTDPKLSDAIVVFDDPFNSQDMHRQFETTSQVRAIVSKACQTIVLSHDPRFLNMIEKDADGATTRTFQLMCTDSGEGTISPWSSANELKTLYVRQAEMIREFASQGSLLKGVTLEAIVQAIRPFLEDYIKARFPGRFIANEQIVAMTDAIKLVGPDDPLFDSVDDLLALNEYTRVNMHGGGQVPDPVALRAQTKKIVALVGKY